MDGSLVERMCVEIPWDVEVRSGIDCKSIAVDLKGPAQRTERIVLDVAAGAVLCDMVRPAARNLSSRLHTPVARSGILLC